MEELELSYRNFKSFLDQYKSDPQKTLLLIANYLFEMYPILHRYDVLYNGLDLGLMKLPENYSELNDTYAFHKNSYVYSVLNAAHDLLLVSEAME